MKKWGKFLLLRLLLHSVRFGLVWLMATIFLLKMEIWFWFWFGRIDNHRCLNLKLCHFVLVVFFLLLFMLPMIQCVIQENANFFKWLVGTNIVWVHSNSNYDNQNKREFFYFALLCFAWPCSIRIFYVHIICNNAVILSFHFFSAQMESMWTIIQIEYLGMAYFMCAAHVYHMIYFNVNFSLALFWLSL